MTNTENQGGEQKYYVFPLAIDAYTVGRSCIASLTRLESTFPEYKSKTMPRTLSKQQNQLFYVFRQEFNQLMKLTDSHLRNFCASKMSAEDKAMMDQAMRLIEEPLGSYDLRELTRLGTAWFDLLIKTKTFAFAQGYQSETSGNVFRRA